MKNNRAAESEDGEFALFEPQSFVRGNKVYIFSNFNHTIANKVIPDLLSLIEAQKAYNNPEIEFYINSAGGDFYIMTSLLSCIALAKSYGIKIITAVVGQASSAASMIAVVGDFRTISNYSYQIIHYGSDNTYAETPLQMKRSAKRVNDGFQWVIDHYAKYTKLTKSKIKEMIRDDHCYLNPQQCLKYGLCDEIREL